MSLLDLPGLGADGAEVLAIGAHPDDIEIAAGGTLLRLRRTYPGLRLRWLVLGASDPSRAEEARVAAEDFGADEIVVEDYPDRFFPSVWEPLKRRIAAVGTGQGNPDLVLAPWRLDRHQDHRTVGDLCWQVFRHHPIWAYEIPKYESDLGHPNLLVHLDDDTAEDKLDRLGRNFPSQHQHPWYERATFEAVLRIRGVNAGVRWAEGFHVEKLVWR